MTERIVYELLKRVVNVPSFFVFFVGCDMVFLLRNWLSGIHRGIEKLR